MIPRERLFVPILLQIMFFLAHLSRSCLEISGTRLQLSSSCTGCKLYSSLVYSKCSKISSTLLFLFLNKMLVIRAGIHKMLVRTANREDPDQTGV